MKVDTMRRIDRYLGIPLCFLLSIPLAVRRLLARKETGKPERTLFIELSEMGSAILADPAMRYHIEQAGGEAFFVIFRKNKPSLGLLGTVPQENIFTIRENNLFAFALDSLKFLCWTREKGIDSVVDLELFSRFTALLAILSGAGRRVGFHGFHNEGLYRGSFLTHRVSYNPHLHISLNFMALVYALHAPTEEIPYTKAAIPQGQVTLKKAFIPEGDRERLRQVVRSQYPPYRADIHRIVLINPNASELLIQRRWPSGNYVDLIKMILGKNERILVLITGDHRERAEAEGIRKAVDHPHCVNFAGAVKFEELPSLYSISEFMVTNDSGPGHFAAVTDMPTYVFFGPETPHLYGSLGETTPIYAGFACSPCVSAYNHRKTPCQDNKCLQAIDPEQVFAMIRPALEKLDA
ncbi:MAG: glycosyltransferase family 9 protein [Smithellaceae bacterium]|nr:glycosyltransferase family 9 protein [Smithellaceae bacterium]